VNGNDAEPGGAEILSPLHGLVVLDLGQYITGPYATTLLAELGADVIKVEAPAGDPFRRWESSGLNPAFVAFNRGKRSIVLNLKVAEDRRAFLDLVSHVDVLVENFRPGVMERLGIGYEDLKGHNDRLVYCSISGFGARGPYAKRPAYDGVALGYSGLAGLLMDPESPRVRGPALADTITGHYAAMCVLAALVGRSRTTPSRKIEVTMLASLLHFLPNEVCRSIMTGEEGDPYSRARRSQAFAFSTKDGKALIIHLSSPTKFWEGLCTAVSQPELAVDPRFETRALRIENSELLRAHLTPLFFHRTRKEWMGVLERHEVPCAPVNTISEALQDEQLLGLELIDALADADVGLMPRLRPPAHWDDQPLPPVSRAPLLDEQGDEIRGEYRLGSRDGVRGGAGT
jgi:crotonobetainyl-CoA:carnitine CoA-transferase CaiB-like acyl-CoA transferase